MELEGLLSQEVEPIKNFYDCMKNPPLAYFDDDTVRIQDFILNPRTVYGEIQGYYSSGKLLDLSKFIERLAYIREIYAIVEMDADLEKIKQTIFPFGIKGKNFQVWTCSRENNDYCLFRIITNMFFLEQLNNVILCSAAKTPERAKERIDGNIQELTNHIMNKVRTYVPKFPKDANWKEFPDFIDEPKEITLYLTQYYGPPYKAKFHPRMIRALLNYADITNQETTGDFMLGSGTLAIESVLLGINTKGSDINLLTKIVVDAKIDALSLEPKFLLKQIEGFFNNRPSKMEIDITTVSPFALKFFKGKETLLEQGIFLNRYIRKTVAKEDQNFFLCGLARVVSLASKRRNGVDLVSQLEFELYRMWKIVYSLSKVTRSSEKFLNVSLGNAEITTSDIRTLDWIQEPSIDLIITSPPYSTAIDYVKNDLAQLLLLELIEEPKQLDESTMGSQRKTSDTEKLSKDITSDKLLFSGKVDNRFHKLPEEAQSYILDLKDEGNMKNAIRCYKFLYDMWDALKQMHRVLRKDGKCIIIIGNNMFTVKGKDREFRNGDFLEQIALGKEIGFSKWREKIVREYSKSSYGTILKEDIIFLGKGQAT